MEGLGVGKLHRHLGLRLAHRLSFSLHTYTLHTYTLHSKPSTLLPPPSILNLHRHLGLRLSEQSLNCSRGMGVGKSVGQQRPCALEWF